MNGEGRTSRQGTTPQRSAVAADRASMLCFVFYVTYFILFLAFWPGLCVCAAEPPAFPDPAPPQLHNPSQLDPGEPLDHPALTFHAAPRPLPPAAVTQDWPCFLGLSHNAVSAETHLLADFPAAGPPLVWEVAKGEGYAAPAIAQGRLIIFHRVRDEEIVDCLQAETGRLFWHFAYPTTYRDRFSYNGGPRASPVIDGSLVYTIGVEGKLHCLKLATGQLLWQRDLPAEFHLKPNFFGVGSTPLVEGDQLIVNLGAPNGPCVAAFDKGNGKIAWGAGSAWGPSYASPVPATILGRRRIFVFAGGESHPPGGGLLCIDPANGAIDFEFPWRSRSEQSVNASNPVILDGQVFISECYGVGSALLDLHADAGKLAAATAWKTDQFGIHFMTPIARDGYLYGVHGHGPQDSPLVCLDLKTGKEAWRSREQWTETTGTIDAPCQRKFELARCSLLLAEGRFLCLGEYGHLLWLDLTPQGCRQICRAWLFDAGESWTCPVLSHGLLYICQNVADRRHEHTPRLLCYDLRVNH